MKRKFFAGATAMISDPRLSALDWRVYAAVAAHDSMSLIRGKGAGCYASNQTLARRVGCDYSNVSKSLKALVDMGYLVREKRPEDRRMSVYRVVYDLPDSWRDDQVSDGEIVGETTNNPAEIVGLANGLSDRKTTEIAEQYIPLKGEIDSVETGEIDSAEAARERRNALGALDELFGFLRHDVDVNEAHAARALCIVDRTLPVLAERERRYAAGVLQRISEEADEAGLRGHADRLLDKHGLDPFAAPASGDDQTDALIRRTLSDLLATDEFGGNLGQLAYMAGLPTHVLHNIASGAPIAADVRVKLRFAIDGQRPARAAAH